MVTGDGGWGFAGAAPRAAPRRAAPRRRGEAPSRSRWCALPGCPGAGVASDVPSGRLPRLDMRGRPARFPRLPAGRSGPGSIFALKGSSSQCPPWSRRPRVQKITARAQQVVRDDQGAGPGREEPGGSSTRRAASASPANKWRASRQAQADVHAPCRCWRLRCRPQREQDRADRQQARQQVLLPALGHSGRLPPGELPAPARPRTFPMRKAVTRSMLPKGVSAKAIKAQIYDSGPPARRAEAAASADAPQRLLQ